MNGALTSSATSVPVTSASDIEVLDTLLVNNEQMYVTAILTDTLTVERGVNGTTAASHSNLDNVSALRYPGGVIEATLMQASRLWTRRSTGFANQVGFSETGQMTPVSSLDLDVRQMLRDLVKHQGGF